MKIRISLSNIVEFQASDWGRLSNINFEFNDDNYISKYEAATESGQVSVKIWEKLHLY